MNEGLAIAPPLFSSYAKVTQFATPCAQPTAAGAKSPARTLALLPLRPVLLATPGPLRAGALNVVVGDCKIISPLSRG